jgi:(4S)-4-hydroxy-5-phosphonooxypentane-2,3-dione isomerase
MFVVAVNLVVDPKDADAFAEGIKGHAKNSRTQSGCLQFGVSRDHDKPGSFHLWEVYTDKAAFDLHVGADFMARWRTWSAPYVKDRVIATGELIAE